jgi:hypothetical protein
MAKCKRVHLRASVFDVRYATLLTPQYKHQLAQSSHPRGQTSYDYSFSKSFALNLAPTNESATML